MKKVEVTNDCVMSENEEPLLVLQYHPVVVTKVEQILGNKKHLD